MGNWGGLERRQFPRVNYPCLITLRCETDGIDAFLTHTENIGTGGVCVVLKKDLKLFSEADIEIDLLDMEKNIQCKGKVIWSVKTQSKKPSKIPVFDVGVEFVDISPKEQKRIGDVVNQLIKKGFEETSYKS
ncbi:MAG: PilZ domain-containing protein [Candidatus Omnitrophica bacterium]|nr:PilZ domain-containing protein [Candidatus Omnitrophota bacterium]